MAHEQDKILDSITDSSQTGKPGAIALLMWQASHRVVYGDIDDDHMWRRSDGPMTPQSPCDLRGGIIAVFPRAKLRRWLPLPCGRVCKITVRRRQDTEPDEAHGTPTPP